MAVGRKRAQRRICVALSDLHCGHRLGLLPPDLAFLEPDLEGGEAWQKAEQGATQRKLWVSYATNLNRIAEFAAGDPVVLWLTGDATHGLNHGAGVQLITLNEQVQAAVACILPWFESGLKVQSVDLIAGTAVHTHNGATEALIAALLQHKRPATLRAHGLYQVDGVSFDLAHHGPPPGSREWLAGNEARYYLRDRMLRAFRRGDVPARVYLRGHYHSYVREYLAMRWAGAMHEADLIIVPSYCGLTEYGQKATRSIDELTIGMVAFEVVDGRLREIVPLVETWDLRTRATL